MTPTNPVPFRPMEMLHGADYNPEQWKDIPGIWDADMRLLRESHFNSVSIGIFSWSELEPGEGAYQFDWMDEIVERLQKNGQRIILGTPSGAKPNWMAAAYPEIRRVGENGIRELQCARQNHCPTSPVYRDKVRQINTLLAQRYGKLPALLAWHISNEFSGYCHCELCKAEFRVWLREKYDNLEALNHAWWSTFWSHRFTDWEQVDYLDRYVHGLRIDWNRFMTHQVATFIRHEVASLREHSPDVPATINMMAPYDVYDYPTLAAEVDFISWDTYPLWHEQGEADSPAWRAGLSATYYNDHFRAMKPDLPMLVMETTPSQVNWKEFSPLKRPGMHRTSCLIGVSRGSEGVCYFQFRAGRGSSEKYHGAVVSHDGRNDTRVFRDVAAIGSELATLRPMIGSLADAPVAVIYDYENNWVIQEMQSPINAVKNYFPTTLAHYTPFWQRGIGVDVTNQRADFARYKIVVAPMLHMLLPDTAQRLISFVEKGGILVTTYLTGYVNETDLCHLGGFPGPLRQLLGIRIEELDALPPFRKVPVRITNGLSGLPASAEARDICELIHAESAEILAVYDGQFYAGMPALTRKTTGLGTAYHLAARLDGKFLDAFTASLLQTAGIELPLGGALPEGVTAQSRTAADGVRWLFLMNFSDNDVTVPFPNGRWHDFTTGSPAPASVDISAFSTRIFSSLPLKS